MESMKRPADEHLERLIFEALGEASMCWKERPTGEFDCALAKEVGDRLVEAIKNHEVVAIAQAVLADFTLEVLRLQDEYDCYGDPIYWATHDQYAPITFFVNCNDLFWWATADAEKLTPEDIPMLRQAILDVKATGVFTLDLENYELGCELWCARKRGMRPQQPAYPKDERLQALFDACGPARSPAEEG